MAGRQGWQPTKEMPCKECNRPVIVNAQTVNPPTCYDCGMARAQDQMRQMHEKSGPFYEAWLRTNGPNGRRKGGGTPLEETYKDTSF